ncbi:hypothetical protein E8M01_01260 [Phreatobacter stygius]|uniref:Uncharacterized protein n=2 Tax=Phreatobacter stygius TaxID=1940610 RepID=A0A4D7APS5_9HYPH|nr:hypothetical protein E8M01_01260 [Phreatobacter stygius]
MRLSASPGTPDSGPFGRQVTGHFDRRIGADRHAVRGHVYRLMPQGTLTLSLVGEPGDRLQLMRRTFPYQDVLSRTGGPVCRSEPRTS